MQEPGQSLISLGTISGRVQPEEPLNRPLFRDHPGFSDGRGDPQVSITPGEALSPRNRVGQGL